MPSFIQKRGDRVICVVCQREFGHTPTCPIVGMAEQLKEITAHMGFFVASMRETLDAIAQLLQDDRPE